MNYFVINLCVFLIYGFISAKKTIKFFKLPEQYMKALFRILSYITLKIVAELKFCENFHL